MNKNLVSVVVIAAVAVGSAAGLLLLPTLQAASRSVDRKASINTERARRLLHEYSVALDYGAMLVQQLDDEGIAPEPEDITDETADEYQKVQEPLWRAYPPVTLRGEVATPTEPDYGNIGRDIREGRGAQARRVNENAKLLDAAMAAVNEALAVTQGEASARSDAEATRLKAVVLYYKGIAERIRAGLLRGEGDQQRGDLADLVAKAAEASASDTKEAAQSIDGRIQSLRAEAVAVEKAVSEDRAALASLDAKIAGIEGRLADAKGRLETARKSLDDLRNEGANLGDPRGAEVYGNRFHEIDSAYRTAVRESHLLEFGGLPQATLRPPGDFLNGRFVEGGSASAVTTEFGLAHYRDERAVLAARVDGREAELKGLNEDIAHLDSTKSVLLAGQKRGEETIKALAESASTIYTELNRLSSEASAIEERAVQFLDQSAKASQAAARAADEWVTRGGAESRDLPAENKDRSAFNMRSRDGWMGAHIATQEADARLAVAAIQYDRYRAASADAEVLDKISKYFAVAEADPEAERTKAEEAKAAGIDAVTQAMAVLERSHGRAERDWTIVAQAADATYLLSMFGRPDYLPDAIEAYRKAVSSRESEPFAKPFVARLARIEAK